MRYKDCPMLDLAKADAELRAKSLAEIQSDTAYAWASRAVVAMQFYQATAAPQWWNDAREYAHEAIEHAALNGNPMLVQAIEQAVGGLR
jgi:hypothetical protein